MAKTAVLTVGWEPMEITRDQAVLGAYRAAVKYRSIFHAEFEDCPLRAFELELLVAIEMCPEYSDDQHAAELLRTPHAITKGISILRRGGYVTGSRHPETGARVLKVTDKGQAVFDQLAEVAIPAMNRRVLRQSKYSPLFWGHSGDH